DLLHRNVRAAKRLLDDLADCAHVIARGDLRHDAAEGRMDLDLRPDHGRSKGLAVVIEHGSGELIAGGFDAEDDHRDARVTDGCGIGTSAIIGMPRRVPSSEEGLEHPRTPTPSGHARRLRKGTGRT